MNETLRADAHRQESAETGKPQAPTAKSAWRKVADIYAVMQAEFGILFTAADFARRSFDVDLRVRPDRRPTEHPSK